MGDEVRPSSIALIFTGDDNVHSQRLLLITQAVREEFYRLEALQYAAWQLYLRAYTI
ncbi:hypothetical protein KCP75_24195 [Salmonella enterica subsp. enterica]|nr:hypothetical protein KCP75_24195 [Salmonella enterica subsp. enterica]